MLPNSDIDTGAEVKTTALNLNSDGIHREKMVYLGRLTSGVAHELNNPIGYISSNIHTLHKYIDHLCAIINTADQRLSDDQEWQQELLQQRWQYINQDIHNLLRETSEGADQLKHVVADLKTLGRSSLSPEYMSANLCILSALNVMTHQLKNNYDVQQDLRELDSMLLVRPQIIQCISNLIHNAIQAHGDNQAHDAPDTHKGIIRICSHMNTEEGDTQSAIISIEDNGPGIDHAHVDDVFKPFFTTKDSSNGSGLGLSIVATIIQEHQGSIRYQRSEHLGGAQFIITLRGCKES